MATPDTRDAILMAADKLFGELGYEAASTREIAEYCGVNKALIHYHFRNKEALFESVVGRYYDNLGAAIVTVLNSKGTVRERAELLLDTYTDFLSDNRNFSRMVQREAGGGRHVGFIRKRMEPLFTLGVDVLVKQLGAREGGDLGAAHALVSFYGMVIAWFSYGDVIEHLLDEDPFSKRMITERKAHLKRMLGIILREIENERN